MMPEAYQCAFDDEKDTEKSPATTSAGNASTAMKRPHKKKGINSDSIYNTIGSPALSQMFIFHRLFHPTYLV
jgi:hypothetical protein